MSQMQIVLCALPVGLIPIKSKNIINLNILPKERGYL